MQFAGKLIKTNVTRNNYRPQNRFSLIKRLKVQITIYLLHTVKNLLRLKSHICGIIINESSYCITSQLSNVIIGVIDDKFI